MFPELGAYHQQGRPKADLGAARSERLLPADSVEKQRVAGAESGVQK
jgi:hypothetical protein